MGKPLKTSESAAHIQHLYISKITVPGHFQDHSWMFPGLICGDSHSSKELLCHNNWSLVQLPQLDISRMFPLVTIQPLYVWFCALTQFDKLIDKLNLNCYDWVKMTFNCVWQQRESVLFTWNCADFPKRPPNIRTRSKWPLFIFLSKLDATQRRLWICDFCDFPGKLRFFKNIMCFPGFPGYIKVAWCPVGVTKLQLLD